MKYVTKRTVRAITRGFVPADGIVLILYRPRAGGIACTAELDIAQAAVLRDQLDEAIALMTAKPERETP